MQGEGGEEEREIQTRGIHVLRHSPTQGDTLGFTKSQLLTYKNMMNKVSKLRLWEKYSFYVEL